eukprot:scaffold285103_cov23-Tisochrysis_lutea.AAC.2
MDVPRDLATRSIHQAMARSPRPPRSTCARCRDLGRDQGRVRMHALPQRPMLERSCASRASPSAVSAAEASTTPHSLR